MPDLDNNNRNSNENAGLDTFKSRLLWLLRNKRMSQTEFTRHLGVSPTYIGAMRKSMPADRLRKVLELFPDLNRDWLLYGEGDAFESPDSEPDLRKEYVVPMLPVEAYAGNLQAWSQGMMLRDCEKVVSPVPGVDFGIKVTGNSMEPEIYGGSTLFIKKINDRSFIPWGNPMVIDSENGVLVKVVYPVAENEGAIRRSPEFIEARSYNPDYPPFLVPTESIYGLYRILANIRSYSTM